MPIQNGSGQGGGNGSVWWSVEYRDPSGKARKQKHENRTDKKPRPGDEEVMVDDLVEGHDSTPLDRIGGSAHPGCFRVQLRFRFADRERIPARTMEMVQQFGTESKENQSWFLEIDVPAIRRTPPASGGAWQDMPWEVVWGW